MRGKERRAARDRLRAIEIFAGCTDDELDEIDRLATEISVAVGQRITREGAGALEFVVIIDGTVTVKRGEEIVATVGAGSFVGEMGLLGDGLRNATVTATTPVRALVFDAGAFGRMLEVSASVRERIEAAATARRQSLA